MNHVLCELSKKIQQTASGKLVSPCTVWKKKSFVHISLSSTGCIFRKAGSCTMCDYGNGESLPVTGLKRILDSAFSTIRGTVEELLVGSCGSVLDEQEIAPDVFSTVLKYVKTQKIKTLIFETHYTTVTENTLNKLRKNLDDYCGEVVIELGLESADAFVLENCWNKAVNLSEIEKSVRLIKNFKFGVVLNIMAGAPFLTVSQQVDDTVKAIKHAIDIGASRANVFPVNIKKNTVIGYLSDKGSYNSPSLWMLVEIIKTIPDYCLDKVEFSWFGDRQNDKSVTDAIPPAACDKCRPELIRFLESVMEADSVEERKNIIESFLKKPLAFCDCYSEFSNSLSSRISFCKSSILSRIDELARRYEVDL